MTNIADDELIKRLRLEYDAADLICQEVEKFRAQAGIPAINELRYAGYHLLKYVSEDPNDEDQAVSAINHVRRAAYEASESGILFALKIVRGFQTTYEQVTVGDVVDNWQTILRRCDEVQMNVVRNRENGEAQAADHAQAMEAFRELKEYCNILKYARDDLNKKLKTQTRNARLTLVGIWFGGASLLAALFFGAFTIFTS
ncbi:hypothetical protein [Pacificibacter sp. AS14]|uniref:hypothetical protein n=1 Tax=Pacificibacter sp. AS14 TaxID=3135785 RepID=UPI0031764C51